MESKSNSIENLELILPEPVEFIRSAAGVECFSGYAAVFYDPNNPGTEYTISPGLKERIDRRAFDVTPMEDVELWFEHSNTHVMGEVRTKTLFLSVDSKGVKFDAPFDATDPDHARALAKIKKRRVNGASIRFTGEYDMHKEGNTWIRTIRKITQLRELSLVNKPAYEACAVNVRSKELAELEAQLALKERMRKLL